MKINKNKTSHSKKGFRDFDILEFRIDRILVGQLIRYFLSESNRKSFLGIQTRLAKSLRPIEIERDEF